MQCVSRAGHQPDLGMRETAAGLAQHRVIADERLAQLHLAVPADGARRCRSMVRIRFPTCQPGLPASSRNMLAPSGAPGPCDLAMTIANPAPSAPVMKCLSPSSSQPPATFRAVDISAAGSDPAPGGGSVIAKHERISPRTSGRRYRSFCETSRAG